MARIGALSVFLSFSLLALAACDFELSGGLQDPTPYSAQLHSDGGPVAPSDSGTDSDADAGAKKCCICFYQEQSGCGGKAQGSGSGQCTNPTDACFCTWSGGQCISAWQKECNDLLAGQSCDWQRVVPKSQLSNPPVMPSSCTATYIAHRGHGTGCATCSTTSQICVSGCAPCTVNISWGGCQTLSGYTYDPANPSDPINQISGSLPAGCSMTLQATNTTDAQGCRQNYYTINVACGGADSGPDVTVTPPNCGGPCAADSETQTCLNTSGAQTTQVCCPNSAGSTCPSDCSWKIGTSCGKDAGTDADAGKDAGGKDAGLD